MADVEVFCEIFPDILFSPDFGLFCCQLIKIKYKQMKIIFVKESKYVLYKRTLYYPHIFSISAYC
jgi:hypothetical protein